MSVPANGPANAKIYVVGEAPGSTEVREGIPFCGPSGKLLWESLLANGVRRAQCRVWNILDFQLPGNKWAAAPEKAILEGFARLKQDILQTKPNIVFALGGEASKEGKHSVLSLLTGCKGINHWRGSLLWNPTLSCKVLPTFHPAGLLRNWENFPLFFFDCNKLAEESQSPVYEAPKYNLTICPTITEVSAFVSKALRAKLISFDIETVVNYETFMSTPTCVGFAISEKEAICIPTTVQFWKDKDTLEAVWNLIRTILESNVAKVAQNGQFDIAVLKEVKGVEVKNLVLDTMCAHHTLYPELPKALSVICSLYTKQPYYKHLGKSENLDDYYKYNAMDAVITWQAAKKIEEELVEKKLLQFYRTVVHPLIPVMIELQHNGVRVDTELMYWMQMEAKLLAIQYNQKLDSIVGTEMNVNSPKQMKEILYDVMGLPPQIKDGKITTGELALMTLKAHVEQNKALKESIGDVFDLIVEIRYQRKMASTYLDLTITRDGRVHTSYNIGASIVDSSGRTKSAPETGRVSSSFSIVFNSGGNLQNITRGRIRTAYVADRGQELLEADLSQAEARAVAFDADERRMIECFEKNIDIHKENARWIEEVRSGKKLKAEEVTPDQRQFAKTHVHAFNYDEGPMQFAKRAGCTLAEGKRIQSRYFEEYPKIKLWQFEIQSQLRRSRTLTTLLGRARTFFGRFDQATFRAAYAYKPQGTVGDLLNIILVKVAEELKIQKLKSKIILQVHDSIVLTCPPEEIPKVVEIIKSKNFPLVAHGREFLIPFEFKTGVNWGELKKWEAPAT